ncbi:MAG: DNA primase [Pseudomonadota bacterium]|uniref:DNA primase n=1 Tax=Gallaecimonas pentaromativorans TaxID=584787 RepID=A0A3N1PLM1_9GAMM|nr:DNA primase [Gallaecimonas pentaromativorans]MED5524767.1 DNA primase [Pseudomonadota bacterium]ROQ28768.1 DNA primase [Gallaecimonas pentaromativorans]
MAGTIPRDFIDDLLARTDIVELVSSRVKLKKAGKNYSACCPFHSEKTPSFSVSPQKQFYYCFGCGAKGDAIKFVEEFDRINFAEAVEELAAMHGLEVPREAQGPQRNAKAQERREDAYALMQSIQHQYYQNLKEHPAAVDYLKGRGLSGDIVKQFGIGFVPDEWDSVLKKFGTSFERQQLLMDTGMLVQNDSGRRYDRFRDRVMFPIRDRRGRTIAFGGRVLGDGTPKYLNSPETRIYHKGSELYGLYEARQANRDLERLVVVEGYMDVVALFQAGITYAVASLGTSTTSDQLELLFRSSPEVICCYDGDRAGREAAWRAMENALPLLRDGRTLKFIFLADGEDPDSMVRKEGKAAFEAALAGALPLSQFLFQELEKSIDMSSPDSRSRLAEKAVPLLDRLPDSVYRVMLRENLAKRLGVAEEQLERFVAKTPANAAGAANKARGKAGRPPLMRLTIAILVQHPALANDLPDMDFRALRLPGAEVLDEAVRVIKEGSIPTTGQLLRRLENSQHAPIYNKLAELDLSAVEDNLAPELLGAVERLLNESLEIRYQELVAKQDRKQATEEEIQELMALISAKAGID